MLSEGRLVFGELCSEAGLGAASRGISGWSKVVEREVVLRFRRVRAGSACASSLRTVGLICVSEESAKRLFLFDRGLPSRLSDLDMATSGMKKAQSLLAANN